jgi:hypothetical protein
MLRPIDTQTRNEESPNPVLPGMPPSGAGDDPPWREKSSSSIVRRGICKVIFRRAPGEGAQLRKVTGQDQRTLNKCRSAANFAWQCKQVRHVLIFY